MLHLLGPTAAVEKTREAATPGGKRNGCFGAPLGSACISLMLVPATMDCPPFIDLRDLESRLADDPAFRPLRRMLRRTLLAQSCTADLQQASDCVASLDALPQLFGRAVTAHRITIEASLLTTAVLLYARATGGSDSRGERGSIKIASKLTPEQGIDHQAIISLRHRAFAHVYTNEPVGDEPSWHSDLIFAVATERGWKPGAAANRVQLNPKVVERLRRQIPVARALLYFKFQERMDQLTDLLNSMPIDVKVWAESFFNPVEVFGSPEAVQQVLGGIVDGFSSFFTSDTPERR